MTKNDAFLLLFILLLTSCSSSKQENAPIVLQEESLSQNVFSDGYIQKLEDLCYARIQRVVGEVRKGRGIIWAECLNETIRPAEVKNYPEKSVEITEMYQNLIVDMERYYDGTTTLNLLQGRWKNRQLSIGYNNIRSFKDSYI